MASILIDTLIVFDCFTERLWLKENHREGQKVVFSPFQLLLIGTDGDEECRCQIVVRLNDTDKATTESLEPKFGLLRFEFYV